MAFKSGTHDLYDRPVNPMDVNLLPLCGRLRSLTSRLDYLRSVTIAVVLIGANITGLGHFSFLVLAQALA